VGGCWRTYELHIRELQDSGENGRGEERSVLDDDVVGIVTIVLVRDAELAEEGIGRLAHDHCREELAAEPSTTAWSDTSLDYGDLEVRTSLGEAVGGGETAAAGANDDDVALGVLVQVGKVAAGHGARDLALTDRLEAEVAPFAGHLLDGLLGLEGAADRDAAGMRHGAHLGSDLDWVAIVNRLGHDGGGCHNGVGGLESTIVSFAALRERADWGQ